MPSAVPVWPTVSPGMYDTSALFNVMSANGAFLGSPPDFVGTQATAQSMPYQVWTPLAIDTTQADPYGGHSNTINNSRYTCQANVPGYYMACGVFVTQPNNNGARGARLQVNGNPVTGAAAFGAPLPSNASGIVTPTREIWLNAGDYLELAGWQSSGGALSTGLYSDISTALWVRYSHA